MIVGSAFIRRLLDASSPEEGLEPCASSPPNSPRASGDGYDPLARRRGVRRHLRAVAGFRRAGLDASRHFAACPLATGHPLGHSRRAESDRMCSRA